MLLLLILLQAVSGYFGFTAGRPPERWLLWLHGIGAYAIVILLFWKGAIILNVFGRGKRWTVQRLAFLVMLGLLLITLFSGLWWTFYGPKYLLGFSVISLHIYLAVWLFALVVWHVIAYRWILKRPRSRDRRAFLSASIVGVAGVALWALSRQAKNLLTLPGAGRRFTGSFERASFSPNFPVVSWINDSSEPIELKDWRLTVEGVVHRPLSLDYIQLKHLASDNRQAILDCTGGWFTEQQWYGVPLTAVLALAQPDPGCQSIRFESITGYARRFDIERTSDMLLATHVAGEILSHGHGFPARLVIPGERGYQWVKWLKRIQLNTSSHLLQPPLPLQ